MPRAVRPLLALAVASAFAFQTPQSANPAARVADPFAIGWMLEDTNGDGIADYIAGRIVVPAQPTAAENAAAANVAARLGYGTTGLTPPVVVAANEDSEADRGFTSARARYRQRNFRKSRWRPTRAASSPLARTSR